MDSADLSDGPVRQSIGNIMSDNSQVQGLGTADQKARLNHKALSATPEERSAEFVAVSGPEGETTSATVMLVAAYALFWVILLGFIWITWRRQQQLKERLLVIESRVAKLNAGGQK